jgi:dienelactone hydrolase
MNPFRTFLELIAARTSLRLVAAPAAAIMLACSLAAPLRAQQGTPAQVEVAFPSGDLQLRGFIWKPEGAGPFPALLWNHGSEKLPGWLPEVAPAFVRRGWVFFIPHRRGHGRSPGPYIGDQLQQVPAGDARSRLLVQLHDVQLGDHLAALAFLKSQPFVDGNRLAVAGCSFGGIQTVLASDRAAGYKAGVDFAGGAQSWEGSPDLQRRMIAAVRAAVMPIFFIQAQNDYDLRPSQILSQEMQRAGKPHQVKIYPAYGASRQDGHEFCVRGAETWSADVFEFLATHVR